MITSDVFGAVIFVRHIIGLGVALLFSALSLMAMPMMPPASQQAEFFPRQQIAIAEHTNVHFAARAPTLTGSNVAFAGAAVAEQSNGTILHGHEIHVASLGFITEFDATNRTASDDPSRATRGTPEYELLNNPPANTRVELNNGTTFRTGEGGFVDEVTYQPVNSSGVRDGRQTSVGREGIAGDVGGHIQACRHDGTCDRFNLFPQNSNFNNSA